MALPGKSETNKVYSLLVDLIESNIAVDICLQQAIYERLFSWIVGQINNAIEVKGSALEHGKNTVIGVLDIYGFEIFDDNRWVIYTTKIFLRLQIKSFQ